MKQPIYRHADVLPCLTTFTVRQMWNQADVQVTITHGGIMSTQPKSNACNYSVKTCQRGQSCPGQVEQWQPCSCSYTSWCTSLDPTISSAQRFPQASSMAETNAEVTQRNKPTSKGTNKEVEKRTSKQTHKQGISSRRTRPVGT